MASVGLVRLWNYIDDIIIIIINFFFFLSIRGTQT